MSIKTKGHQKKRTTSILCHKSVIPPVHLFTSFPGLARAMSSAAPETMSASEGTWILEPVKASPHRKSRWQWNFMTNDVQMRVQFIREISKSPKNKRDFRKTNSFEVVFFSFFTLGIDIIFNCSIVLPFFQTACQNLQNFPMKRLPTWWIVKHPSPTNSLPMPRYDLLQHCPGHRKDRHSEYDPPGDFWTVAFGWSAQQDFQVPKMEILNLFYLVVSIHLKNMLVKLGVFPKVWGEN